jgi:predicted dehydrogenase
MTGRLDRREFLHRTAAGGAALAAFSTVAEMRAAEAPGNTVVVAIMGTNGRGDALSKVFAAQPGCAVAYVCDVDDNASAKGLKAVASKQEKAPQAIRDFRRALDDKSVDALVVAAPDHWHAPATILGCAAGKHVYCEKPACHNGREGELMIAAARKNKRVVQMGNQRRSSEEIAKAVSDLQSGKIGRVLLARGWINSIRPSIGHGKPAAVPAHLDYSLWQGPAPERPYVDNLIHYQWHWFWNWGTGELGNNGIHALDLCRWGLGVDYPRQVVCSGGKFHFDDDQETPDTQLATYSFGDKAITWEHRTWSKRGFEDDSFGAAFYGEAGTMVIGSKQIIVYDTNGKQIDKTSCSFPTEPHAANFLAGIRSGEKLNSEIEEGVKSTALCHLGNIAYRSGRTVNFDPATRQIIGDAEQTALWGREYRPGWEPKV